MIVDDLIQMGIERIADTMPMGPIIRVPYRCVIQLEDGGGLSTIDDALLNRLTPYQRGPVGERALDSSWANPPYTRCVLTSTSQDECAALWFQEVKEPEGSDWCVLLAIKYHQEPRPLALPFVFRIRGAEIKIFHPDDAWPIHENAIRRGLLALGGNPAAAFNEQTRPVIRGLYISAEYRVVQFCVTTFALLNARNITLVKLEPSRAERRRCVRESSRPAFSYHVLRVTPFSRLRERGMGEVSPGVTLPLHWIRGHFKVFTPERPLFGRYSGRFWWQPTLHGRDQGRYIDKDYVVENVTPSTKEEEDR